jgi:hypothetical protein
MPGRNGHIRYRVLTPVTGSVHTRLCSVLDLVAMGVSGVWQMDQDVTRGHGNAVGVVGPRCWLQYVALVWCLDIHLYAVRSTLHSTATVPPRLGAGHELGGSLSHRTVATIRDRNALIDGDVHVITFGADPTGMLDSSAAIAAALQRAAAAPGIVTVHLDGGTFLLDGPVVVQPTQQHEAGNGTRDVDYGFATIQDGTFVAGTNFPQTRYMLELFKLKGMAIDRVVFLSGHRGGALRIDSTMQSTVTRSYFHEFASHGIFGSDDYANTSWAGHELVVDSCWFEEWNAAAINKMPKGAYKPVGTAIEMQFPDSMFHNNVVSCGKVGFVIRGDSNLIQANHFWNACAGSEAVEPPGGNAPVVALYMSNWGSGRVFDCQFDRDCQLLVENPEGLLVRGNTWHGGHGGIMLSAIRKNHVMADVHIVDNMLQCHRPASNYCATITLNETVSTFATTELFPLSVVERNIFGLLNASVGTRAAASISLSATSKVFPDVDLRPQLLAAEVPFTEVSYSIEQPAGEPLVLAPHGWSSPRPGVVRVESAALLPANSTLRVTASISSTIGTR